MVNIVLIGTLLRILTRGLLLIAKILYLDKFLSPISMIKIGGFIWTPATRAEFASLFVGGELGVCVVWRVQ